MLFWLFLVAQVILIDLVLSGDNVVVIAGAANVFPKSLRPSVILGGLSLAFLARVVIIVFAGLLIHIKILSVVGGLLLFWVAWKMIKAAREQDNGQSSTDNKPGNLPSMLTAIVAILVADLSMSLDNIVAIAGLTRGHPWTMVFGLALSLTLVGFGATFVSRLLEKAPWLNYVGAGIVGWVGVTMII